MYEKQYLPLTSIDHWLRINHGGFKSGYGHAWWYSAFVVWNHLLEHQIRTHRLAGNTEYDIWHILPENDLNLHSKKSDYEAISAREKNRIVSQPQKTFTASLKHWLSIDFFAHLRPSCSAHFPFVLCTDSRSSPSPFRKKTSPPKMGNRRNQRILLILLRLKRLVGLERWKAFSTELGGKQFKPTFFCCCKGVNCRDKILVVQIHFNVWKTVFTIDIHWPLTANQPWRL